MNGCSIYDISSLRVNLFRIYTEKLFFFIAGRSKAERVVSPNTANSANSYMGHPMHPVWSS